jgi:ParB family chromosome partitioning protein
MIDVALIDEDPHQPRSKNSPGLTVQSIAELASSYGPKGPKTPLSLRDHDEVPGRYIINHGHRRFRAAKYKHLTAVPAFIDNDYDDADQVIENLQRDALTAREIADWIGRELAKGKKKSDVAKRLGKSPAFISQHVTLLDLPEPISAVFNSGRVNDVTVINELVTAFKANGAVVASWLSNPSQEVTRGEVKLLRAFLDEKRHGRPGTDAKGGQVGSQTDEGAQNTSPKNREQESASRPLKKPIVHVQHDGKSARLLLTRRPQSEGCAWIRYEDGAQDFEVRLEDVRLVAVLGG